MNSMSKDSEGSLASTMMWNDALRWPVMAKLVGNNAVYYMTKFSATLGRGTLNSETADFLVSEDHVISRLHARISYSTMQQGYELEVVGKNGIYVNGRFITKNDAPAQLSSQVEIIMGKQNPVYLTFLLPTASCTAMDMSKQKQTETKPKPRAFDLVQAVGECLVRSSSGSLPVAELADQVWSRTGKSPANPFKDKKDSAKSVLHVLKLNRYFVLSENITPGKPRAWTVRPENRNRFVSSYEMEDSTQSTDRVILQKDQKRPRLDKAPHPPT